MLEKNQNPANVKKTRKLPKFSAGSPSEGTDARILDFLDFFEHYSVW